MFNKRGQAFDAFKLLIAAVVAGAILVIILSMLSGFITPGQDPMDVMSEQLQKVKIGGVTSSSAQVVKFMKGTDYSIEGIAKKAGIPSDWVEFECEDVTNGFNQANAEGGTVFTCSATNLVIEKDISGKIKAHCPTDFTGGEKCWLGYVKAI